MYRLALLGRDISYTRSPSVHAAIAQATGEDIRLDVADVGYDMLGSAVDKLLAEYDGFFVTKPYKTDVKKYIGFEMSGGVNVVRCKDRAAFNTDGAGFMRALDGNFEDWRNDVNGALVLGAGGAAYSIASELKKSGKRVYVLNRTLKHALRLCAECGAELYINQPAELVVNCTSLGINGEDVLRALCVLPNFKYAFDLVYGRGSTPFLNRCAASGASVADGKDMLIYQAIEGDKILLGRDWDVPTVFGQVSEILKRQGE
ncbi:MAG: hypothetical protein K2L54_01960 [Clostridiales bacterium]|nr:hypothetical protein [Clostridiales bacterium]